jgi:hypothetical protein
VLELMVRFELRHGSPRSAQVLLSELRDAPAALRADVDSALAREAEKDAQLQRLKTLEETLDPRIGTMSRTILALVIGGIWVVLPVIGNRWVEIPPGAELVRSAPVALLCAVILTGVGIYSRKNSRAWTPLNRQLLRIVVFAMVMQAVLCTLTYLLGFESTPRLLALLPAYWSFVAGLVAVSIFPSVWPTALAYLCAAIAVWHWPEQRYAITTVPSVILGLNALSISRAQRRR